MNVCLQSLFACPGFYNLLQAISENQEAFPGLDPQGTIMKLVHIQKHLDSKYQFDKPYSDTCVNAEMIFREFLKAYNPDNEQ